MTTMSIDRDQQPAATPRGGWTVQAVRELGLTTDVETAGAVLGIGRTKAYELAQAGEFPAKILRVGRRYLVPTPALLELLGVAG
jgi:excisionase family DNA binding protein